MKRTGYLTMVCFAFVLLTNGQKKTIQMAELYGDWTLYYNEDDNEEAFVFQRQKDAKNELDDTEITISLLAFDECKVNYDKDPRIYCGIGGGRLYEYTWAFNKDLQIIKIYKSDKWMEEFKKEHPEEFEKLGLPDNYNEDEMELATRQLKNGNIGLEIVNWE